MADSRDIEAPSMNGEKGPLANVPEEDLWAELVRRVAAVRCGYCYPAMASDEGATALVREHGYEFGPWQHIEFGHRLAEPPSWEMYARIPATFRNYDQDDSGGMRQSPEAPAT